MKMIIRIAAMPLFMILIAAELLGKIVLKICENAGSVMMLLVSVCIIISIVLGQKHNILAGVAIEAVVFSFLIFGTVAVEMIGMIRECIWSKII